MIVTEKDVIIEKMTRTSGKEVVIVTSLSQKNTVTLTAENVHWHIILDDENAPLEITPDGTSDHGDPCYLLSGPLTKLIPLGKLLKAHFVGYAKN